MTGTCFPSAGAPTGRRPRNRLITTVSVALVALTALISSAAGAPVPAGASTGKTPRITIFIHGYNPTSNSTDCAATFGRMIKQLKAEGMSGAVVTVGFYSKDVNCDVNLRQYGEFGNHSSWLEISRAFSRYVWDVYTKRGIPVDVVGYSMGGLIARGAIMGARYGAPGWSKPIDVRDAITLGTPHLGAAWYSNLCVVGQCASLRPSANEIKWLALDKNPQGLKGTDWTTFGSKADWVVPEKSAAGMTTYLGCSITYKHVDHTGSNNYMGNATVTTRVGTALVKPLA